MDKFDPNEHLVDLKGKKYLPVAPRVNLNEALTRLQQSGFYCDEIYSGEF